MHNRRQLGRWGEEFAAALLETRGYRVVERNWRCSRIGEIDLVVCQESLPVLVFVEVRVRRGANYGTPEESITAAKQARLKLLAQAYVQAHAWEGDWRIDVVALHLDRNGRLVCQQHIEDAVTD
jgi:putative endonuclease